MTFYFVIVSFKVFKSIKLLNFIEKVFKVFCDSNYPLPLAKMITFFPSFHQGYYTMRFLFFYYKIKSHFIIPLLSHYFSYITIKPSYLITFSLTIHELSVTDSIERYTVNRNVFFYWLCRQRKKRLWLNPSLKLKVSLYLE